MARIGTYTTDTDVSGSDKVLGTDTTNTTKNYTLDSIGEYFTKNNVVTVAGQLGFVFEANTNDAGDGQFYINGGAGASGINLADVNKINVSVNYSSGDSLEEMLDEIIDDKMMLVEARNQNVKAILTVQSYAASATKTDYKDVTVTVSEASGSLTSGNVYVFAKYDGGKDKSYTHTQSSASSTWSVSHSLNKKPSVSIVDSSDNLVRAHVEYTDLNNLTITLSAPTSGKAYLN